MQAAIVGAGFIGQLHRKAWEANGVDVVAMVDPYLPETTRTSLRQEGVKVVDQLSDLYGVFPSLDVFSVCTPPGRHLQDLQAIWQGFSEAAVLMEKPVSASKQDYLSMMQLAEGKKLMIGLTQRFYPEVRQAATWVAEGRIGRPLSYHDTMILSGQGLPSWYSDLRMSGGGVLITNGVHLLDRMQFICGAELGSVQHASIVRSHQAFDTIADLSGTLATDTPYFLHLEWSSSCELQQLIIFGTEGRIELKTWEHATLYGQDGMVTKVLPYAEGESFESRTLRGLVSEVHTLLKGIDGQFPKGLILQDHLSTMEVIWDRYEKRSDTGEN